MRRPWRCWAERLLPQQGGWPGCERQALWGRPGQGDICHFALDPGAPRGLSAQTTFIPSLRPQSVCQAAQAAPVNNCANLFGSLGTGATVHPRTLNPSLPLWALCDFCHPILLL